MKDDVSLNVANAFLANIYFNKENHQSSERAIGKQ
jgi:hypothetical protein